MIVQFITVQTEWYSQLLYKMTDKSKQILYLLPMVTMYLHYSNAIALYSFNNS